MFLDKEISDDLIKEIIECAVSAPSSMNSQPWQFIIVKDKEVKEQLANIKEEGNQQHIRTAPISIVVCVDTEKSPGRYIEDGVSAIENILLAVHDLGLGAVYITGQNPAKKEMNEELNKVLNLPENIIPIAILPIGYADPAEEIQKKELVKFENVVHFDKWKI